MNFDIINPRGQPSGWNDGLLAHPGARVLFVAGQTARNATGKVPKAGFAKQFRQALANALEVVEAAGGTPKDVARMTVYVTSMKAYRAARKELAGVWKELMGTHYPAMALVEVSALMDTNAVLEIETTAVVHPQDRRLV
jgi:enamine deaminase RidA (YjgF/YER057c/UK114 family)